MKKYGISVKSLNLVNKSVVVGIAVHYTQLPLIPLFNIEIDIDRKDDAALSFYESLALKKAASLIHHIADDLIVAA